MCEQTLAMLAVTVKNKSQENLITYKTTFSYKTNASGMTIDNYSLRSWIFVFLEISTSDYIRSKISESTL